MSEDDGDPPDTEVTTNEALGPVLVGLGAGIVVLIAPESWAAPIVVAGALLAGWFLPKAPMVAALLYLVPTVALGAVRLVIDVVRPDDAPNDSSSSPAESGLVAGGVIVAIIAVVLSTAIFTHVGAIVARRRSHGP